MVNDRAPPPDGYVRLSKLELRALRMYHLASEIDASIGLPGYLDRREPSGLITGFTEWAGMWDERAISIGWDWGVVKSVIVMLNPSEIRTNVQVVDENGFAAPLLTRIYLLEKIETLPWADTEIPVLIANLKK
jgi:Domain of unknown function (DUF4902)